MWDSIDKVLVHEAAVEVFDHLPAEAAECAPELPQPCVPAEQIRYGAREPDGTRTAIVESAGPQWEAIGTPTVERFTITHIGWTETHGKIYCLSSDDFMGIEAVDASDHDRIVAELRAEVERLKSERSAALEWFPVHERLDSLLGLAEPFETSPKHHEIKWVDCIEKLTARAEAAEAERDRLREGGAMLRLLAAACQCEEATDEVVAKYGVMSDAECHQIISDFIQEEDDLHALCMRQGDILTGVVNAIKGAPPERTLWSHHDAAILALNIVTERDDLRAKLEQAEEEVERLKERLLIESHEAAAQNARGNHLEKRAEAAEAKLAELAEHERQTHERLGAILGTDDSLEECAKRLKNQLRIEYSRNDALARIRDVAARIAQVFGDDVGFVMPIDGELGCVQFVLNRYKELEASVEKYEADGAECRELALKWKRKCDSLVAALEDYNQAVELVVYRDSIDQAKAPLDDAKEAT